MDILFLSQRVPYPPNRGDRITTFHILRHFLGQGHRVTSLAFTESVDDEANAAMLEKLGATVVTDRLRRSTRKVTVLPHLLTRSSLTVPFFSSRRLSAAVRDVVAAHRPDLCFAYSSSMGQYLLGLDDVPRIQHFAELDSDKWDQYARHAAFPGRWIYGREARTLLRFETRIARAFDLSLVVSEVERELFATRIPGARVAVLANGVDSDYFSSAGDQAREPATLIFTGVMDYEPNVDAVLTFVRTGWPLVRARFAGARFLVVGSAPTESVRALSGRDGIEVTGTVPDTRPWFERATVAIAPLRIARGLQNKVLEAMSMGVPVVTSPMAAQGVAATDGVHFLVADGPEATAAAVVRLLDTPGLRRDLGRAAREFVVARYDWRAVLARLDALIDEVRGRRS